MNTLIKSLILQHTHTNQVIKPKLIFSSEGKEKAMKEQLGFSKKGLPVNLHISCLNGNREELSKIETGFSGLYVTAGSANLLY